MDEARVKIKKSAQNTLIVAIVCMATGVITSLLSNWHTFAIDLGSFGLAMLFGSAGYWGSLRILNRIQ